MTMENTGPQISHDKNCAIDPTGNFRTQLAIPCSVSFLGGEKWWKKYSTMHTVDGRNPARRTSWGWQFISCLNIQAVVVWVFWTINSMICVPPPPQKKNSAQPLKFQCVLSTAGGCEIQQMPWISRGLNQPTKINHQNPKVSLIECMKWCIKNHRGSIPI